MAGYSGTPLPKKLGIKDGHFVFFSGAPKDFGATLGALPKGVTVSSRLSRGPVHVIVLFAKSIAALKKSFAPAARMLDKAGGLWVAWPKKASGVATDLDENVVRAVGLGAGLVDNKVCAIDATWSGLRFVYRVEDRPARP